MPSHNHTGTTDVQGGHSHTSTNGSFFLTAWDSSSGFPGVGSSGNYGPVGASTTNVAGAHSHNLLINNTGGGLSHNILPRFVALAFIMKL